MNRNIRTRILVLQILLLSAIGIQGQDFRRNIEFKQFVPKGQWIVGSSLSYSEHNEKNYQFLIVEGFNSDGYTFNVTPLVCYAFRDNVTAGGRFSYGRTLSRLSEADIIINDDNQFNINDMYSLKHSFTGMAILRNYISLGDSRRFALFCETQLQFSKSQSKVINGVNESLTGTFKTGTDLGIGLTPGMVAFINNYIAVEVNVGVLGFNFTKERQITDQVHVGEQSMSSGNFKINLFSLGLGIAFYL
ncbi:MAG: hypothetical protein ACRC6R_07045 [Bacteroidales bacterium]